MKKNNVRTGKEIRGSIVRGLNQALRYSQGKKVNGIRKRTVSFTQLPAYSGIMVKQIRQKHNLTQNLFAIALGVSIKTIEAWEANKNIPQGPAQRILFLLDKKPAIINAFRKTRI
jgi:putative transcriptional regulator